MRASAVGFLIVVMALLVPAVLAGGAAYVRFVLAFPWWLGSSAVLGFIIAVFAVRRVQEFILRTPGASSRFRNQEERRR